MVTVNLWSGLRSHVDGRDSVEIEANNVGEVLRGLVRAYPQLEPVIAAGVSVAVDGRIYAQGLTQPVAPDSEVFLLQRIKGG